MIAFFKSKNSEIYAVHATNKLTESDIEKYSWVFSGAEYLNSKIIHEKFIGPRKTMVTPWSTNAVEIVQNMGICGVLRIEFFTSYKNDSVIDKMTSELYTELNQKIFDIDIKPEKIIDINDIYSYNQQEGLALSNDEIKYLEDLSKKIDRKLTDSEVFGFSQVNSEHCRHKIFNGKFIIEGKEMDSSLFDLIKKTTKENLNYVVSAYKDNVAFIEGPLINQFAPELGDKPSLYKESKFKSIISLKAETHNFPTTVEPFSGAATGSGGEIRDRLAGGQGSLPLAGTAVYMTPYPRIDDSNIGFQERKWLYQKPIDILIKASNGASDFGNKFGQPLISGSLLTFEHKEEDKLLGFDKVIMLAGGIGFAKHDHSKKKKIQQGDLIVVLGGDNYRIGMGGAAVSSTETGNYSSGIELNAVQRSNPEMQKRVSNAIRAVVESENNFIKSIHDHGAGGHLNCISELVEESGGVLNVDDLPIGDKTLSAKEIIGNESQERMGLVIHPDDLDKLKNICARENAPIYVVGEVKENSRFLVKSKKNNEKIIDLSLSDFFGNSPKTVLKDKNEKIIFSNLNCNQINIKKNIDKVINLESVACKDWLTNKVDRCVTGKVALQQCTGPMQLPLNNCGVMALDFDSNHGVATSIGHSPITSLIDPRSGTRNSIGEALTNLIWCPLKNGLKSVSLSANWMWPANNDGENSRLYEAVKACSDFCIDLGINVPTGKDSMSMKQKYSDKEVLAPGTVIISATGQSDNFKKTVEPYLKDIESSLYYVDMSSCDYHLGGSALYQANNKIGNRCNDINSAKKFKKIFNVIQNIIKDGDIHSGHDISSGGMITCLLEMCFVSDGIGLDIDLSSLEESDIVKVLFSENHGIIFQADEKIEDRLINSNVKFHKIGFLSRSSNLSVVKSDFNINLNIDEYRKKWFKKSYLFDKLQSGNRKAKERFDNLISNKLNFKFPDWFKSKFTFKPEKKVKAAILRDKGSNSEREMAYAMYKSGFDVRDIHMTDLISGKEDLSDIKFLVAVGGFSNSDVLGSAKGWAGSFIYNEKANSSLKNFYKRDDTLSLGVCNGCQLFIELGLLHPNDEIKPKMDFNESNKFECIFTSVKIANNNSIMFKDFGSTELGIWSAHGEGRFKLPKSESEYNIIGKYSKSTFPTNPNGSDYDTAILSSKDGRHIAMMPHLERSTFPWNWGFYPKQKNSDDVSPWIYAFVNAYNWLK
jgi:phosphoribosylformylglycinamidine synthase